MTKRYLVDDYNFHADDLVGDIWVRVAGGTLVEVEPNACLLTRDEIVGVLIKHCGPSWYKRSEGASPEQINMALDELFGAEVGTRKKVDKPFFIPFNFGGL